jgi:hypothetical protein
MAKKQEGGAVAQAPPEPASHTKDKPVHEIRIGRMKATIWQNQTDRGARHNVTIRRLFKRDENSQWEQSDSFGRDDLFVVGEVARAAALWIYANG